MHAQCMLRTCEEPPEHAIVGIRESAWTSARAPLSVDLYQPDLTAERVPDASGPPEPALPFVVGHDTAGERYKPATRRAPRSLGRANRDNGARPTAREAADGSQPCVRPDGCYDISRGQAPVTRRVRARHALPLLRSAGERRGLMTPPPARAHEAALTARDDAHARPGG